MPTLATSRVAPTLTQALPLRGLLIGVACLFAMQGALWAQTKATPATATAPTVLPGTGPSAPTWAELSGAQRQSLAPLASNWDSLGAGQRRKWIALAQNYPVMAAPDKEKLHSRMAEWAALKPKDREMARLNFAQTKKIAPSDRAANWEAYQALSPEEKKKLAEGSAKKPVGAAVAVKPVSASKLAKVPVTRHTPETERALATSKQGVDRNTLLPQRPQTAAVLPAPTNDVEPAN
ncbi:DUF3106 domain-containing protein [Rhodoferax saidenbachensis]|uniref:DUF3106 domain-containing protein n=1 Tax=Rhodoferax saidenbachensis TaxID=1484693 RepID=A0A1P8K8V3_9BURK|nr:DUF3106 domain-containing protein [Rhodoferax saidenbachensis]APW42410.1 hypothetical protein RS694_07550 [Rhodoferax saidenbachensis]